MGRIVRKNNLCLSLYMSYFIALAFVIGIEVIVDIRKVGIMMSYLIAEI